MAPRPDEQRQHTPASSNEVSGNRTPPGPFRQTTKRLSIHPLELTVLWLVCIHLVFLPWAIGAMRPWGHVTSFILSVISFVAALAPRNYGEEHTRSNRFRLIMWPKLVRFPIFWLGLSLLGYIALQASNPSWEYKHDGTVWWMSAVPHINWLPTGVRVPFERWSQGRMLLIYSAGWLTVCALWVGFTRRRSFQILLMALVVNGVLLAAFGVAQRVFGNGKLFWFWESPNPQFFSSFVYKNHGGAYLNLMLGVTWGLAGWYYIRGLRRMEKSDPSVVIAFFAICIAASVLTSHARGATLVMLAFMLASFATFIIYQLLLPKENRRSLVSVALITIFGVFLKPGLEAIGSRQAMDRLKEGITRQDAALESRESATQASLEMLRDHWKIGVGAGSFRHVFPVYQHRHPELVSRAGKRMFWEHAHNDVIQFPIELGLTGMLLVLAGGLYYVVDLTRHYFWENPLIMSIFASLVLLVVYAWWDFPFQNPAVLITWCCLWAVSTAWVRIEESGVKA